ncbi:hypothetical protein Ancab_023150 [Ancistrocladus abbreviatus]
MEFTSDKIPKLSSAAYPSPSPAEQVGVNEHLLTEILLRVPAKSLVKFKSVSREWNSLISSTPFIRSHTRFHHTTINSIAGIFLRRFSLWSCYQFLSFPESNSENSLPSISSPTSLPNPSADEILIMQSCNGLLLCCPLFANELRGDSHMYYQGNDSPCHDDHYYICNPTTNCLKAIPRPPSDHVLGISLAFDPHTLPQYRVVCLATASSYPCSTIIIYVYYSDAGCWKECIRSENHWHPFGGFRFNSKGVYWKGAINWICSGNSSLCFDVGGEHLYDMPSPPVSWRTCLGCYFECGGQLCVIEPSEGHHIGHYKLYVMESYDTGWHLKYDFNIDGVMKDCMKIFGNSYSCSIPCFAWDNEKGRFMAVVIVPDQILAFDLEDKTYRKLCEMPGKWGAQEQLQFEWFNAYPYVESLASV